MITLFVFLGILLVLSGCLQKTQKLGCCVKANATADGKCYLYNITNSTFVDLYSKTLDCNETLEGYCNVSVGEKITFIEIDFGGEKTDVPLIQTKTALIPICSSDDLLKCIDQNCTVMVCGDFTYNPRIAPGVVSMDDAEEMVPPETDEDAAQGFYNAQCKFYPMDSKLKARMSSANAMVNRFRFGIGGTFDEFDLYKNYFPMSDKYCAINPFGKVDRFMNYIGGDLSTFDPVDEITQNCINDSDILTPFTFGNSSKYPTEVLPEKSSYKFTDHNKFLMNATDAHKFSKIDENNPDETYKELDRTWYRKNLATIYAENFYETLNRAPFECSMSGNDCMSGLCKNDFYSRAVSVAIDEGGNEIEVPTDCNSGTGPDGGTWVFCNPTTKVNIGTGNSAPKFTYAKVTVKPWQFFIHPSILKKQHLMDGTMDEDFNDTFDHFYFCKTYTGGTHSNCPRFSKNWYEISTLPDSLVWTREKEKDCEDHGGSGDNTVWCPPELTGKKYPPAAQIAFFGRDDIRFRDKKIIGYAVIDPEEFEKTLFAKNCKIFEGSTVPYEWYPGTTYETATDQEKETACKNDCISKCGSGKTQNCTTYCYEEQILDQESDSPCIFTETYDDYSNPHFERIVFDPSNWTQTRKEFEELAIAFNPIYEDRLRYLAAQDWHKGDNTDVAWSTMFWLPAYTGVAYPQDWAFYDLNDPIYKPYYLSGAGVAHAYDNNIYDLDTPDALVPTAGALLSGTVGHPNRFPEYRYYSLFPRQIYLLKSKTIAGREMIGSCEVLRDSLNVKQFGWCESCTVNTLAYQKITTKKNPYIPFSEAQAGSSDDESLCTYKHKRDWTKGGIDLYWTKCYAPGISDLDDYNDQDTTITGSPRTEPEASLMKERLEKYLKSGIMPVLDITDDSNWDLTSPWVTGTDYEIVLAGNPPIPVPVIKESNKFTEYDFKRLLGNNGAMVVIVDMMELESVTAADRERVLNRTKLIRSYCWRCLTAVDIPAPDNQSFETKVTQLFVDPRMKMNVDILTHSYVTSKIPYDTEATDQENAQAVLDNMASYGRISIQKSSKPVLFSRFNVPDLYPWDESNHEVLFRKIIEDEGELVKAGVIGVIYSPGHQSSSVLLLNEELVDVDNGIGVKTPKFCALEKATSLLASSPPRAQFARSTSISSVNCTLCTSLDKALGQCDTQCDNGIECTVPNGGVKDNYRCPADTVLDTCKLCNATFGSFLCNKTYTNGTIKKLAYSSVDVSTDMYGDVIGGLEKPNKCCLRDARGTNYTYVKKLIANVVNAPIVYPKSGDPNTDCGISSSTGILTGGQFCGVKLPVQDYDIKCSFVEIPIVTIEATLPEYEVITAESLILPIQPFSS
jgi:hypothetical protein